MSDDTPDPPGEDVPDRPGLGNLFVELGVPRHAKVGAVAGLLVAGLVYVVRVFELLGPAPQGAAGPALFLSLAFVLAFGTFVLVTVLLATRAAIALASEYADRDPPGRSPVTLGLAGAVLGYVAVRALREALVDIDPGIEPVLALAGATLLAATVGLLTTRLAAAVSVQREWQPRPLLNALAAGLVALAAVGFAVAPPTVAVGLLSGTVALGGLLALAVPVLAGVGLGFVGSNPPHGVLVGALCGAAAFPLAVVLGATPLPAWYLLPVLFGVVGGVGTLVAAGLRRVLATPDPDAV